MNAAQVMKGLPGKPSHPPLTDVTPLPEALVPGRLAPDDYLAGAPQTSPPTRPPQPTTGREQRP
jgi:hypothetical protein